MPLNGNDRPLFDEVTAQRENQYFSILYLNCTNCFAEAWTSETMFPGRISTREPQRSFDVP